MSFYYLLHQIGTGGHTRACHNECPYSGVADLGLKTCLMELTCGIQLSVATGSLLLTWI